VQITVEADETITQGFTLAPDILQMEGAVVTGTRSAQAQREATNSLTVLGTEEIQDIYFRYDLNVERMEFVRGVVVSCARGAECRQRRSGHLPERPPPPGSRRRLLPLTPSAPRWTNSPSSRPTSTTPSGPSAAC
jgi:hypothetical protein